MARLKPCPFEGLGWEPLDCRGVSVVMVGWSVRLRSGLRLRLHSGLRQRGEEGLRGVVMGLGLPAFLWS
jgi:hypothetical protein